MNQSIETLKILRNSLLTLIDGLTIEQLNEIPGGFINNIAWNVAHVIAAQQAVCYVRADVPPIMDEIFISLYKPGTKPEGFIDANEFEKIKGLLLTTIDQLETDYNNKIFAASTYNTVTTRYGVELSSTESAINFLPFHEGLHMGYIMALKRVITK